MSVVFLVLLDLLKLNEQQRLQAKAAGFHQVTTSWPVPEALPLVPEVMKRTELQDAGVNDRSRDAEMGCPCNRPQFGKGVQSSTEDGVNIKCSG